MQSNDLHARFAAIDKHLANLQEHLADIDRLLSDLKEKTTDLKRYCAELDVRLRNIETAGTPLDNGGYTYTPPVDYTKIHIGGPDMQV